MRMIDSLKLISNNLMGKFKRRLEIETKKRQFLMIEKVRDLNQHIVMFQEDLKSLVLVVDCLLLD